MSFKKRYFYSNLDQQILMLTCPQNKEKDCFKELEKILMAEFDDGDQILQTKKGFVDVAEEVRREIEGIRNDKFYRRLDYQCRGIVLVLMFLD